MRPTKRRMSHMAHPRVRTAHHRLRAAVGGVAALVTVAGCASGLDPAGTAAPPTAPAHFTGLPSSHVHGVARDAGDGKVYLATHDGLFRYDRTGPVRVGPVIDLMGFAVAAPGRFYASGHPGIGVDLPQPVGLIESTNAGRTWTVRARAGQSDFHALTASAKGVLGFDGTLRATTDGRAWRVTPLPTEPRALAASPDGSRILATTASGVLASRDHGTTWTPVGGAPFLLAAWADNTAVAGVTPSGGVAVSTDAGATWTTGSATVGSAPQALSASRAAGRLEVLVVSESGIEQTDDGGASFKPLPGT